MKDIKKNGKVFLVGAGPGDPGLITLKGIKCINKADVIVYDYLVSSKLLNHARNDSKIVYVGKKEGEYTFSQDKINDLIVFFAKNGNVVARVKGGDPFIFGRGGEEIEALVKADLDFEIVPGVTSAIAASAYAGIPLTHRRVSSSVIFVTGHESSGKDTSNINWLLLAKYTGTIVFFMGIKNLFNIIVKLKKNGKSGDTPVAIVRWGTTLNQTTLVATVDTIVEKSTKIEIKPPAIIIIGDVVKFRDSMKWFEKLPLFGKSILVTRARAQASELVNKLNLFGAKCIEFPTIKIKSMKDSDYFNNVMNNIVKYDWLIFTSVNGVSIFFDKLFVRGKDVRVLGNISIAAIGPATSDKLLSYGIKSDVVPQSYCAESIVSLFSKYDMIGKSVCLPRALETRDILPLKLSKMGAIVHDVPIYETIVPDIDINNVVAKLQSRKINIITFTSSSTVRNFVNTLSVYNLNSLLVGVIIACIGPITAKTASMLGLKVDIIAKDYTIPGLCESILSYFS